MALSANRTIDIVHVGADPEGIKMDFDVAADTTIYQGAFVALNASGYLIPLAALTPATTIVVCKFVGIALDKVVNTDSADPSGTSSDGGKECQVLVNGAFQSTLSAAAVGDIGAKIYASDDTTLTKVALGYEEIGTIWQVPASGKVIVKMREMGGIPERVTGAMDGLLTVKAMLVHPNENHNGLICESAAAFITTVVDSTTTDALITLKGTGGSSIGPIITLLDNTTIGDIHKPIASTTMENAAQDAALTIVPAGEGVQAVVTVVLDGDGTPAGAAKVVARFRPIA